MAPLDLFIQHTLFFSHHRHPVGEAPRPRERYAFALAAFLRQGEDTRASRENRRHRESSENRSPTPLKVALRVFRAAAGGAYHVACWRDARYAHFPFRGFHRHTIVILLQKGGKGGRQRGGGGVGDAFVGDMNAF